MNTLYKEEINPSFRLLVNKQLPLLKESGFSNYVSLVMCPTCQKLSSSENLQCMFLLMGGRNPVDSEPCSPINYYIHWLVRDPDSLPNDNQRLEMAQDRHKYRKLVDNCSAADGWWWRWYKHVRTLYDLQWPNFGSQLVTPLWICCSWSLFITVQPCSTDTR